MKKWLKYATILSLLLGLVLWGIVHFVAPYAIVQPPRINEALTPEDLRLDYRPLAVTTPDSVVLRGYWINSAADTTRGIVLLLHGIGGCKEHLLPFAQTLAQRGIAALVFDGRAHGQSGGAYCTYGAKEKQDIACLVDHIERNAPPCPIGIWGSSMGGAIALQALAYDPRIDFGIVESTFTQLDQIVFDYMNRYLRGFGLKFISDYGLRQAGLIADFDPESVQPIQSVQQIHQPVFLAHGDADANISVAYGQQLFQQLAAKDKSLEIVEGGGHFDLAQKGGPAYYQKVMAFLEQQL